jgi:hypothetical protein
MTQNYVNLEDQPLETIFLFPIDKGIVFSKMTLDIELKDGSKKFLEAKIEEKDEVKAKYDDAVASGKTVAMGYLNKS